MKKYSNIKKYGYFKPVEEIVDLLVIRTNNKDRSFFRAVVCFSLAQVASNMRCSIVLKDRGTIPVNFYTISCAPSGYGKGHSNGIMTEIVAKFRKEFMESTLPFISNFWLEKMAAKLASKNGTELEDELSKVNNEYESLGEFIFSFSEGSLAGMKQLRTKMLMAKIGALSFIADEIGSNLTETAVMDIIKGYLELFDMGHIGDKVLKNSSDNKRIKQVFGFSPANMQLFGAPVKLFDGGATEAAFRKLLAVGMARRCFFAYSDTTIKAVSMTPEEVYEQATSNKNSKVIAKTSNLLRKLADTSYYNVELEVNKKVSIALIAYQQACYKEASKFLDSEEEKKAELEHSYFKVIKLAGVFAFIDRSPEVTMEHLNCAIRMGLDSSKVFQEKIIIQEHNHTKLLRYLCARGTPATFADMRADLPFFPTSAGARQELFTLAASEGYISNITLTHKLDNNIDLYEAKRLTPTNINSMVLAYSSRITEDYENELVPFKKIHKLTQEDGLHWVNHHLDGGYRSEEDVLAGFNLIVLDLDKDVEIETVEVVLSDYCYHLYTTKRHKKKKPRFRVVMPISHEVKLNSEMFTKFMRNVNEWLPFKVDEQTTQRSRKWLSCKGKYITKTTGKLLDAHQFIPQTTKANNMIKANKEIVNLPQLEKWFIRSINDGATRNTTLIKYALVLVDKGLSHEDVISRVSELNQNLSDPIKESEISTTISVTVAKRIAKR